MAISQEDIQQVLNAIKAESQGVQELEEVTSLNGVNSLPAVKGNELVSVPVSLLQKPATDAAAKAEAAAQKAETAAGNAEAAKKVQTLLQKQQMHQHKKPKQPLFRLNK